MSLEGQKTAYGIGYSSLFTLTLSSKRLEILNAVVRRKIMKQALTPVMFVMAFVNLLVLGLVSRVQAGECSNVSVKGAMGSPARELSSGSARSP